MSDKMTITEALAETKTIKARIDKKHESIYPYLTRDGQVVDPHAADGGSAEFIRRERQAVADLMVRLIAIRTKIQASNLITMITIEGVTRSVSEWLTWRKEIAGVHGSFIRAMFNRVNHERQRAQTAGRTMVKADENPSTKNIITNVNDAEITRELETHEKILGTLDGKLSLVNATTTIEV
jgi:hypothetical protein